MTGAAALVTKLSRDRIRPPVGWASVLGGGAVAGIGFTVSLLIASLAFSGEHLAEAKLGVLTTLVVGPAMSWAIICITYRLPKKVKLRLLIGRAETIVDLTPSVDPERDHIRGPAEAAVTLVEYGDLECPYCGQAENVIRELLSDFGDLRYVWRHLPLNDVHPHAQLAAEASEAAGAQGKFWEMHDMMLAHQDELTLRQIMGSRPGAGAGHGQVQGAPAQAQGRAAHRRGRRVGRHERRVGDAVVLHQRPPPPGRLRHRHAVQGGALGARAGRDHAPERASPSSSCSRKALFASS